MIRLFIILFALLALPTYGQEIQITIHVDAHYRPFSFSDRGKAKGMYIEILKTAFSRMKGFKVTMIPVPWRRGKKMMETGDGFGLTPAFFHGHDWPYLYPYSQPYYTETIIAVCHENILTIPRPNWPKDYINLTIGNVAGFDGWGGPRFRDLVYRGMIHYEEAKGSQENILKVANRRLDCIMMEDKAFDFILRKLKKLGKYVEGKQASLKKGAVIGRDPVYIGYSKPSRLKGKYPFQYEFMQALDSQLYHMIKKGEIKKIMDAYQE